jgi:uncharacterized membrane protein YraQ (UPF0718 family)
MIFQLPTALNNFFIIFYSIIVEGMPFILIGSLLSGIMEYFVSPESFDKFMPKKKVSKLTVAAMLGNLMPVCECGNIPFARRLIKKRVEPYIALTFLLAAPVLNPIVIASTVAAFPNDPTILFLRLSFTFLVATGTGFMISKLTSKQVLSSHFAEQEACNNPLHSHSHNQSCESGHCAHKKKVSWPRLLSLVRTEFFEMTGIFLFGATIAASIQMFIPKSFVFGFNQFEWLAILAMMLLAFIVSICSNVDAFFALAYSQVFPMSSILAFLVFGPMIDIKAVLMMRTIFNWKTILLIALYAGVFTFLLCYAYFLWI